MSQHVLLDVQGVTKAFGGLLAVRDVSFTVSPQEILGLIGPNGAGKTTLFSLIVGAQRPTRGRILYQGRDITRLPPHERVARGIVRTHQIPRPFRSMTVFENVLAAAQFGSRDVRRNQLQTAWESLEFVGIATLAEVPVLGLSVGNLKRLELARALASRPTLLLLDEICGGLTEQETAAILQLVRRVREDGVTVIYIEHNMRAVMGVSDRVIVLDEGRKLVEGLPSEVQQDPRVVEAYLGQPLAEAG